MSSPADNARDDLAYMRALVEGSQSGADPNFALTYFWGGLIYGLQVIGQGLQTLGVIPVSAPYGIAIGVGPTVIFLAICAWVVATRGRRPRPSGMVSRMIASLFGTLGMTNLVFLIVTAVVAIPMNSLPVWLLYGCAVFILQGAAWMMAYVLRRQVWLAAVGLTWFAFAIGMAFAIRQPPGVYIVLAGLGLFGCMMAPGLYMLRQARKTP